MKSLLVLLCLILPSHLFAVELSDADALRIGKKIWINECAGTVEGLTSWNKGEDFPSLGIGHFIWYRQGQKEPFEESFPKLAQYLVDQGVEVPSWLRGTAPWQNREEFMQELQSQRMKELRSLLHATVGHQARFMAIRMQESLPKITANLPEQEASKVKLNFERMMNIPHGIYVLMDYVNFKGEGVSPKERYQGKGWGLLQVLEMMNPQNPNPLDAFADASIKVLTRRIELAPRDESRWLKGWTARCNTYRKP